MSPVQVNPDEVIVSTFRALKDYVELNAKDAGAYEFIWSYPSSEALRKTIPLKKPIVYFEISDIENPIFGFGANVFQGEVNETTGQSIEYEATQHIFEFDVGVFASAVSGGATSRLVAWQMLRTLFCGAQPYFWAQEDHGFEILSFQGGTNIMDSINDQEVYRTENLSLRVQAFGRHTYPLANYMAKFKQAPSILVDGEVIEKTLFEIETATGTDSGTKTP